MHGRGAVAGACDTTTDYAIVSRESLFSSRPLPLQKGYLAERAKSVAQIARGAAAE